MPLPSVIALSKLYSLNDERVAQIMVKGDLIIPESSRIMTRSKTKKSKTTLLQETFQRSLTESVDPDRYTIIPAPLKIIKVLIEELLSASGRQPEASASATFEDADDGEDGWEDLNPVLDLGLGGTKEELMEWSEGMGKFTRQPDDETQTYLIEFFLKAMQQNSAEFSALYPSLTQEEKNKLQEVAQVGLAQT